MKQGKKRIAMLGHKRVPSREGGIEVVVEELAARMAKRGYCVTCYNRSGGANGARKGEYRGIRLKIAPAIDKKGLAALTASVTGALKAAFGKYDVVHFHAEGPAFMCWLPKIMGKKVVVTIHGLDHQRAKWGKLASAYIMMGERAAAKFAHEIIVLSRDTQKYFQDVYNRKTQLIPNGVNRPVPCQASLIRNLGLEKDGYILFLGRIVPEKGLAYLIQAFQKVRTEKSLVIAGGDSDSAGFMKKMKELAKGDPRIQFIGFVEGDMLGELYSNAYVYCLPSDLEGMPLTLLEAMSYGNCCLVSDIPGCTEVIEDKALIFQKGNIEDLRNKLQELCDDEALAQEYRAGAADFICGKYLWEDVVEKTLVLYE